MNRPFSLAFAFTVSLVGCATFEGPRPDGAPTGMNRTHETKDSSGRVTQTSEPIKTPSASKEKDYHHHHGMGADTLAASDPSTPTPTPTPVESVSTTSSSDVPGLHMVGIEASAVSTQLWHAFTTEFQSSSFNNLNWNPEPDISGTGAEAQVLLGVEDRLALMLGGGGFRSDRQTNAHEEGNFYVHENTRTNMFWLDAGARIKPVDWFYFQALAGLFVFDLKTSVNTNAPTYTYDGLSGTRVFPALGVGGGLETPWRYPLRIFGGARFWVPIGRGSFYESAAGQLNAGLLYRF